MKITKAILDEIDHWKEATGRTNADLARLMKVSPQAIGQWYKPQARFIKPAHWVVLVKQLPRLAEVAKGKPSPSVTSGIRCPLSDCPARGIEHEPLTAELLADWSAMNRREKLEALQAIDEIRAKQRAAAGI